LHILIKVRQEDSFPDRQSLFSQEHSVNRTASNHLGNTRIRLAVFILFGIAALGLYTFSSSATDAHAQTAPAAAPPVLAAASHPELPEGAGKDVTIRVCTKCHSADNIIANRQNRAGWENTISKMVGYGADGSDDDYTAILEYLVKNFGPANAAPAVAAPANAAPATQPPAQ
jgi:cytochrome c5